MTQKRFARFIERDVYCWHCGLSDDTLIPHHRANRGMGGSKLRDRPSNIIVVCSLVNGAMESDPGLADAAAKYGWKLASWQDPTKTAVFDRAKGLWFYLDDDFNRVATRKEK